MELSGRQLAQSVRGPGLHPQGHTPTHQQTDTHTPTLSPAHPFNVQSLSSKLLRSVLKGHLPTMPLFNSLF